MAHVYICTSFHSDSKYNHVWNAQYTLKIFYLLQSEKTLLVILKHLCIKVCSFSYCIICQVLVQSQLSLERTSILGKTLTCNDKFCSLAFLHSPSWIKSDCFTLNIGVINIQRCNNTDCQVVFLSGDVYTGEIESSSLISIISMGLCLRAINHPDWVSNDVAGEPNSGTSLGNLGIWSLEYFYGDKHMHNW